MTFKLIKKNFVGYSLAFLLILAFNESQMFNFLLNDNIGKLLFLGVLLYSSYIHKFLGYLILIALILAFNKNELNVVSYNSLIDSKFKSMNALTEGFKSSNSLDILNNFNMTFSPTNLFGVTPEGFNNNKVSKSSKQSLQDRILLSSSEASTISSADEVNTSTAIEGFCFSDKEINILKGKSSKSIPNFSDFNNNENIILPSFNSDLISSYSFF